jgi:hypothetical protein
MYLAICIYLLVFSKIVTTLYKYNKNEEQKQEKSNKKNKFNIEDNCTERLAAMYSTLRTIVPNVEYNFINTFFNRLFACPNTFIKRKKLLYLAQVQEQHTINYRKRHPTPLKKQGFHAL